MTAVEKFQVVAAIGAGLATLAFLLPTRAGRDGSARHLAALGVLGAAWLMLGGSLVGREDLASMRNRLGSLGVLAVAAVVVVAAVVTVGLVRLVLARPVVWFALVAIALPIRLPVTLGSQSANLLLPLYLVTGLGFIALFVGVARGRLPVAPPRSRLVDLPLGAFVAFSLVSTAWSSDIQEATVKIAFFYLPFVILARLVATLWPHSSRPLRTVAGITVGLATAAAVVALVQYATKTIWWNGTLEQANAYNRFFRANGIFYDPNILGRYLALAMVTGVALLVVARSGTLRPLLVAACLVMAAGLAVTFSRSSALMLMVGLAILAVKAFGVRRTLIVGVAGLLVVGGPAFAFKQSVRDRLTSWNGLTKSGEGRFRLAGGGVDLWRTQPVAGVGLGAFSHAYEETLPRKTSARTRVFISHTAPVTVLAELGTIGIALFAVLALGVLVALWRGARLPDPDGLTIAAVLAILAGIFVHSLLYSALFEDPAIWVLLGMAAAIVARPTEPTQTVIRP